MMFKPNLELADRCHWSVAPFHCGRRGTGGGSSPFHHRFVLCCLDLYVLYQAADRRARPQWLVIQSSAQILWRRRMTSCLLFPQVHLRGEYGTFMALSDAFYGFIMEFPTEFPPPKKGRIRCKTSATDSLSELDYVQSPTTNRIWHVLPLRLVSLKCWYKL